MKQFSILLLGFMAISVRAQPEAIIKEISIAPFLVYQNYEHFKRLCLSSPNSAAEFIEGFDLAWGYQYQLKVEETILESALSDGTE